MATRKKAQSTLLKEANEKIVALEKSLASEKASKDNYCKYWNDTKDEIEQVHQILDAVPNSVARQSGEAESYNRVIRKLPARLAAWLAAK